MLYNQPAERSRTGCLSDVMQVPALRPVDLVCRCFESLRWGRTVAHGGIVSEQKKNVAVQSCSHDVHKPTRLGLAGFSG
jgi:hypothetical protein